MQAGHPIGRARAALRALHRAQRSGEYETDDVESNAAAESGNLEVSPPIQGRKICLATLNAPVNTDCVLALQRALARQDSECKLSARITW